MPGPSPPAMYMSEYTPWVFYAFISYRILVWGLTHPTILEPLCKIQKKIVRVITLSDKYSHSSPLFHNLKLLKLKDIHSLNLVCFVYESKFHGPIVPFKEFFIPLASIHDYGTRKALKGDLFSAGINTTQHGERTAKYTCSILWNNLESTIKNSPSLNVFKKRFKNFYLSFIQIINCLTPVSPFSVDSFGLDPSQN